MIDFTKPTCLMALLSWPFALAAQMSFTATPTLVTAEKTADFFVFYNYTQLENLTGDTLEMRWKLVELTTSLGGSQVGDWTFAVTDPEYNYNPLNRDSADFTLLPISQVTDKFIYQIFPNDQVGTLTAKFLFYPVADPLDSVLVTFQYTVADPATATKKNFPLENVQVFPNPADDVCYITNHSDKPLEGELMGLAARRLRHFRLEPKEQFVVDSTNLPAGTYLLRLVQDSNIGLKRLVISH